MAETVSFNRTARDYLESEAGVLAPKSVRNYGYALRVIGRDAERLGLPQDVRAWGEPEILALKDIYVRRYAPISLAMRFSALNNMLMFVENPIMDLMRRRRRLKLPRAVRGNVHWQSEETAQMLISRAEGNVRMVLVLGYGLGLRRTEITELRLSDIGGSQLTVMGKGSKQRTLPLEGWVLEELRTHIQGVRADVVGSGPDPGCVLLHRKRGLPTCYCPMGVYRMVKLFGRGLGMELTLHEMRRTFAMALRKRGTRLEIIQVLLGHQSIETTRQYIQACLEDEREALREMYSTFQPV